MNSEPEGPVGARAAALIVLALGLLLVFLCYGAATAAVAAIR